MDLSSIVSTALQNLTNLLPFRLELIESTEHAIKFSFGRPTKIFTYNNGISVPSGWPFVNRRNKFMKTGVHFRWAFFEQIYRYPSIPWNFETGYQTLCTKDGVKISTNLFVDIRVDDPQKWHTVRCNPDQTLENRAQALFAGYIVATDYREFIEYFESYCEEITETFAEEIRSWGATILDVKPINMVPVVPIRLIGDDRRNEDYDD